LPPAGRAAPQCRSASAGQGQGLCTSDPTPGRPPSAPGRGLRQWTANTTARQQAAHDRQMVMHMTVCWNTCVVLAAKTLLLARSSSSHLGVWVPESLQAHCDQCLHLVTHHTRTALSNLRCGVGKAGRTKQQQSQVSVTRDRSCLQLGDSSSDSSASTVSVHSGPPTCARQMSAPCRLRQSASPNQLGSRAPAGHKGGWRGTLCQAPHS
jgi:hypothetical protein